MGPKFKNKQTNKTQTQAGWLLGSDRNWGYMRGDWLLFCEGSRKGRGPKLSNLGLESKALPYSSWPSALKAWREQNSGTQWRLWPLTLSPALLHSGGIFPLGQVRLRIITIGPSPEDQHRQLVCIKSNDHRVMQSFTSRVNRIWLSFYFCSLIFWYYFFSSPGI